MPRIKAELFGRHPRMDWKPGFQMVTPTTMKFVEEDGTDIRVERVRFYDSDGKLVKVSLRDRMGALFGDLPDVTDDWDYLEAHTPKEIWETTRSFFSLENG